MPGIIALVLIALVALAVLSFAVHFLFSPWLLLLAVGVLAWIKFRPRRSRREPRCPAARPGGQSAAGPQSLAAKRAKRRLVTGQGARRVSLRSGSGGIPGILTRDQGLGHRGTVAAGQRLGGHAMGDHTEQHGEAMTAMAVRPPLAQRLQRQQPEDEPTPGPAGRTIHEPTLPRPSRGAQQGHRHRQHPDERQAEHGIGRICQVRLSNAGTTAITPNSSQTSSDTRAPVSSTKGTNRAAPGRWREPEPAHERGDKAVAVQRHRGSVAACRQPQYRRAGEALGDPATARPTLISHPPTGTDHHADRQPSASSAAAPAPGRYGPPPRSRPSRERDQHDRRGDPVVEPALDVDQPADPGGTARVDHHARAQCGVGWRQSRTHQQREPDIAVPGQGQRQQGPQADRQRQPDASRRTHRPAFRPQVSQADPRGVGEQHQGEGGLRQQLDQLMGGATPRGASGPWVSSSPARTNAMGAVTSVRSSRADSAAHTNISAATIARSEALISHPRAGARRLASGTPPPACVVSR